ncbi:MAG: TIGR04255 family protein, partial [Candidatus Mariimomonas ferrooxydans]
MEKYPLLKSAPITEALIDIRVKLPDDFSTDKLCAFTDRIQADYPTKKEVKKYEGRVDLLKETAIPLSKQHIGYRYDSKDNKQVVQATIEGFTFSRLKPYITWKQLRDETRRIWGFYKEVALPEAITRVALRYINNLNIPI